MGAPGHADGHPLEVPDPLARRRCQDGLDHAAFADHFMLDHIEPVAAQGHQPLIARPLRHAAIRRRDPFQRARHDKPVLFINSDQAAQDHTVPGRRGEMRMIEAQIAPQELDLTPKGASHQIHRALGQPLPPQHVTALKLVLRCIEIRLGQVEMPCDATQVMRRGHTGPVEIPVELLAVDSDLAADLRDGPEFGTDASKVGAEICRHCGLPLRIWTHKRVTSLNIA